MESEGDGLLLDLDGVAEVLDCGDDPVREGLRSSDGGEGLGGFAHWVHGAAAVYLADADGDLHGQTPKERIRTVRATMAVHS